MADIFPVITYIWCTLLRVPQHFPTLSLRSCANTTCYNSIYRHGTYVIVYIRAITIITKATTPAFCANTALAYRQFQSMLRCMLAEAPQKLSRIVLRTKDAFPFCSALRVCTHISLVKLNCQSNYIFITNTTHTSMYVSLPTTTYRRAGGGLGTHSVTTKSVRLTAQCLYCTSSREMFACVTHKPIFSIE